MSTVVTRRTRARAAQLFRGSSRHRRDAIASAAKAFSRSETHRGLPTGTIALRRRRARVFVFVFAGESAFGFASRAFRCVRGSMFSLFSSSQLAYARCRGKVLVFLPGLPAFRVARCLAASGPISSFVAPWAGNRAPSTARRGSGCATISAPGERFLKHPLLRPRERRGRAALLGVSDAWARSETGSAPTKRRSRTFVRPSRRRSREQSGAK